MLEPIVADQKDIPRLVLVHEFQIAIVCSRNNGSSNTSASSNTRCRTEGRDSFSSLSFTDKALTNASGVVTRISLLVKVSDFLLPFELASVLLLIAMIGAIILARREFLPEQATPQAQQPALTLPERPRELMAAGSEKKP